MQKTVVGNQTIYLTTGHYVDGRVGEIFVNMAKQGSGMQGVMRCFAIAVSIGLQYGVPLEEFVDAFINTKFPPSGPVFGSEVVEETTSIVDYIFRELGIRYLGRTELGASDPEDTPL